MVNTALRGCVLPLVRGVTEPGAEWTRRSAFKILWIVPRLFLLPESTHLNIASHDRGESMRARGQSSVLDRDDDDARFALRRVVYATFADLAEMDRLLDQAAGLLSRGSPSTTSGPCRTEASTQAAGMHHRTATPC